MAITKEEREMLDKVNSDQSDFYAGVIALALFRYDTREKAVVRENAGPEVAKLVVETYSDVEDYYNEQYAEAEPY